MLSNLPPMDLRPTTKAHLQSGPLSVASILIWMFSRNDRKRLPPTTEKTTHVRLITVGVSHFCEKGRWALDLAERRPESSYYITEDAHCPGFHSFATVEASSDRGSVTPMVVFSDPTTGDDQVLSKSTPILKHFCPELYPTGMADEIEKLENDWGMRLGACVRCLAFHHILSGIDTPDGAELAVDVLANRNHIPKVERFLFSKLLTKGIEKRLRITMKVNERTTEVSLKSVREVFEEVSNKIEALQQSSDSEVVYIMDEHNGTSYGFTAADLAFCALAGPVIRPPELSSWWTPSIEERMPTALKELREELLDTPAGRYVLQIYKKHRCDDHEEKVTMKNVQRGWYPWK